MKEFIYKYYTGDDISEDMKLFNVVHSFCFIFMLVFMFVVDLYIPDSRAIYISFGVAAMFLLTMIEGNRTGKTERGIIAMSILFNVIYIPMMYFMYNTFSCVIPIYFIFGIIYTVLLVDVKKGILLSGIETLVYMCVLAYGKMYMQVQVETNATDVMVSRYIAAMFSIVICGSCLGVAVRYRYMFYQREQARCEVINADAMDAYVAKDMFLINMSHEIRTPMNAIAGYINLLLDQNVNERISDSAYNIMNSCNALLSITDELMDLSKSERGEVDLYISAYDLNELLMEIINIMTVRLVESSLSFYVEINKDIPRYLYGDISKIRQIFVNLLNNAVKFTTEGKITLRVDYALKSNSEIELIVDVEDTGEGIRNENISRLFNRYDASAGSDDKERYEISGLGLAICSEILEEMNGDITVRSEYGVGSCFTFRFPQRFDDVKTIVNTDNLSEHKVLIFEKDDEHASGVSKILDSIYVNNDIAKNRLDFERLILTNKYTHIFIANENNEECSKFLDSRLVEEKIIAVLDLEDSSHVKRASSVLYRPLNLLNVVSLLNNESNNYVRDVMKKGGFICPHASILVVDDNITNLNVASAILKKYQVNVLNAVSGKDCLRVLSENNVDLIFLDYMMPEMNGIDTLYNIRKLPGSQIAAMPVIALTANVVSGAREMFLEAGFDDFLAKPIAIDKMEKMLRKYLPKELVVYQNSVDFDNE